VVIVFNYCLFLIVAILFMDKLNEMAGLISGIMEYSTVILRAY